MSQTTEERKLEQARAILRWSLRHTVVGPRPFPGTDQARRFAMLKKLAFWSWEDTEAPVESWPGSWTGKS
jgi:hypothetical protein